MQSTPTNIFIERLLTLGLTPNEATIYLYLLEHGKDVGGSNIAVATKLHRQYVYNALPQLIEVGLVSEVPKGKQNRYKAEPPVAVEKLGRKQAVLATDLAQDLESISNIGNEQEFEVIQGVKAMREFEMDYVSRSKGNTEELILGSASGSFIEVMNDSLEEYLSLKEEKNILVRYLGSESEIKNFSTSVNPYKNQTHRFLKQLPDGTANMVIRQDVVCFYSYVHPPHVYVVKSKATAEHYKEFFEMLWKMSSSL